MLGLLNTLLFITLLFSAIVCITVSADLSFSSYTFRSLFGPRVNVIFFTAAILVSGLFIIKSISKWAGIYFFREKNTTSFLFNSSLSGSRSSWIRMVLLIELIFLLAISFIYIGTFTASFILVLIIGVMLVEQLVFIYYSKAKSKFRVGVNKNAIITTGLKMNVYPFSNLKSIESKSGIICLTYKNESVNVFNLDLVPEEQREHFFKVLREVIDSQKVYISI